MSQIVPFPLARRRAFIARQAKYAAVLNATACERHIATQIKIQREAMLRKGIDERLVRRELSHMELAIRTALRFRTQAN
jgi:hypothetical protein